MKLNHIYAILSIFAVLILGSCKKEGEFLTKPVKAIKPYEITGYAIGDVLEQYFDGVKVRDYYGRVTSGSVVPQIVFENDVTLMQFKKKSNGQVVYEQKFDINDTKNEVPKFFFDGTKLSQSYPYPKAQGTDYLVNFFIDGPKDLPAVDIDMDVLEYYYDNNNNLVIVQTSTFPIASNVATGKWTEYLQIQVPPSLLPTQPGTEFYPIATIKNAKTKQYLINNDAISSALQIELPDQWTSQGKTQSIHIQGLIGDNKALYIELNDLVKLFP